MKPTNTRDPQYYRKVVDCAWACPAHTPVPEYIRLIAEQRYTEAYVINWQSNVFPGVLGRTCDRPCEVACRRGRVEKDPVAICRLKRVAADLKQDFTRFLPSIPTKKNGKKIALIGAGPVSLTVARDLMPLGYEIDLYDKEYSAGGFMKSQIPAFRLPLNVLNEEVNYILEMGVNCYFGEEVRSLKWILDKDYDAVFIGTGAPRGRDLDVPGRQEAEENIHIGIDWLSKVAFEHTDNIGKKVVVLGGGNTAMDCCRTARRLGGAEVHVVVRSGFGEMKASPWEKEDSIAEDIDIINYHVPKEFVLTDGKLSGVLFERVEKKYDGKGKRLLIPTGEPDVLIACDDVLVAVGQENSFPWIERDIGLNFDRWGLPVLNEETMQSSIENVFFGGDAAFGPKNIIWAVAHGHQAAISIDLFCEGLALDQRPEIGTNLVSQKMGLHQWSYENDISNDARYIVPAEAKELTLKDMKLEVELGYDAQLAFQEAERCLNCDIQTEFNASLCIECDGCVDICPTKSITFTENRDSEAELRCSLNAPAENIEQGLFVSESLKTKNIMVKDEDVCLHCGLCAERCPTGAWDMQKLIVDLAYAGDSCQK